MATYFPPKRATALVFGVSLPSYASSGLMQSTPTLAAGDVKISKDGGALANLTTLPTVTPAAGKRVEVSLSATEATADNVTVIFSDQTVPPEWCDVVIHLQPTARQIDDLAFPATSGRSMVVDASGLVDANVVKLGPTGSGTAQTAKDVGAINVTNLNTLSSHDPGSTLVAATDVATLAQIENQVWDAQTSAHVVSGSMAELLTNTPSLTWSFDIGTPSGGAPETALQALYATAFVMQLYLPTIATYTPQAMADYVWNTADTATYSVTPGSMGKMLATINATTDFALDASSYDGFSFIQIVRLMASVLLGKGSGLETATAIYRAADDSKARVTATVDPGGNRTALTLDPN